MRRIRDVFYINANFNENYFLYYGMEFKEFIKHNPIRIENVLVTEDYFNITKGKLDTEAIGKFLKSIDSSYDIMVGL